MTRAERLAEAMLAIAKANHYMVGLVETVTDEELIEAEQILIRHQNSLIIRHGAVFQRYELALDLIEQLIWFGARRLAA